MKYKVTITYEVETSAQASPVHLLDAVYTFQAGDGNPIDGQTDITPRLQVHVEEASATFENE